MPIKNAENAYKTAGMTANKYMENVTGFSASLLQSLGNDTEKAADLVALVNAYRNENGLDTLEVTEFLQEKANIRGYQTSYYWEHLTPAGQSPTALYSYSAENLAWCAASTSAQDIFDALKDCEDHNAIMLSPYLKNRTATSVFCKKVGEDDYEYYWVQVFR